MSVAVDVCPKCEAKYLRFEGHRCRLETKSKPPANRVKVEERKPVVLSTEERARGIVAMREAMQKALGDLHVTVAEAARAFDDARQSIDAFTRVMADLCVRWMDSPRGRAALKRIRGEARYEKQMARRRFKGAITTRPGESLIDTVRAARAARAGNVPRGTSPNPRFLEHIARTKAKPRPIAKSGVRVRGLDLPQRTLADVLGVPPETKMTSLPLPEAGIVTVNDRESK